MSLLVPIDHQHVLHDSASPLTDDQCISRGGDVSGLEASRRKLCLAQIGASKGARKILEIDEAIRKLQQQRTEAVIAQGKLCNGPFAHASREYSREWNLAFTSELYRLPRELRDMVYSQVWSESYIAANRHHMAVKLMGLSGLWPVPHIVDPSYVGKEIALEALESFYTHNPYGIFEASDPASVVRLVYEDLFGVGLDPATVLRSMTINLDLDDLTLPSSENEIPMEDIKCSLVPLLDITKKKDFRLRIELRQKRIRLKIWNGFFDILRPILHAFDTAGASVNITWIYSGEHKDYGPETKICINKLIEHTPSDWKDHIKTWLDDEDNIPEHHREYWVEDDSTYDPNDFIEESDGDFDSYDDMDDWDMPHGGYGACSCTTCMHMATRDLDSDDIEEIEEEGEEDDEEDDF